MLNRRSNARQVFDRVLLLVCAAMFVMMVVSVFRANFAAAAGFAVILAPAFWVWRRI